MCLNSMCQLSNVGSVAWPAVTKHSVVGADHCLLCVHHLQGMSSHTIVDILVFKLWTRYGRTAILRVSLFHLLSFQANCGERRKRILALIIDCV